MTDSSPRRGARCRRTVASAALAAALLVAACAPSAGSATPVASASDGASAAGVVTTPRATISVPATAGPSPDTASAPTSPSQAASTGAVPAYRHVYLIVMENHEYGSIVGSSSAPFINRLIASGGLVTRMTAVAHPSEPNYIALTSGGTQGVSSDGAYDLDVPNLFDQVEAGGRTWHVYAQGFPGNCSTAGLTGSVTDGPGAAGEYARKHDPAISYVSIRRNPGRCAHITGLVGFDPAAADLALIVPNQTNDMHSSSIEAGDSFLATFVPAITGSAAFAESVLVITWDEGVTNDGGGGHIATIVLGAGIPAGSRFDAPTTHYSILRTIEDAWSLGHLGEAAHATPIVFAP